jgi:ubiquinol oxidase
MLEETENERMHLMTFIQIAQPMGLEKTSMVIAQIIFFIAYFIVSFLSPKTSHRLLSYLGEEKDCKIILLLLDHFSYSSGAFHC